MTQPISAAVKMRINFVRFVMIFGIVVLHTPEYVNIVTLRFTWFGVTKAFFQNAFFRCTVPVLTCISGYLLFRSGLDTDFKKLVRKKVRTLAVPFLVCNLTLVGLLYVLEAEQKVPVTYQLFPFSPAVLLDAIFGLTKAPIDYPLNFVRDLFVLVLLAPIFGQLLRARPWAGMLLVILIFGLDLDGYLVIRTEMPIMFYIGGMAAVMSWNVEKLDRHAGVLFFAFLLCCVSVIAFRVANTTYLRFLAPFLLWPVTSLVVHTDLGKRVAKMGKYSFFIYLLHAPLLVATYAAYKKFLPGVPYAMYWFLTPVVVTVILIGLHKFGNNFMPSLFNAVFGERKEA